MALGIIPGIQTLGQSAVSSASNPGFWSQLGTQASNLGGSLWGGVQGAGQEFNNAGLDKLLGTGVDLWQAERGNKMNQQLLGQRQSELGMQQEAFNRDKAYQDALKSIDWSATQ